MAKSSLKGELVWGGDLFSCGTLEFPQETSNEVKKIKLFGVFSFRNLENPEATDWNGHPTFNICLRECLGEDQLQMHI
ncbi:unnamed protein product [Dovyalis caffra]|uniref:Uncharacterized protein n=1 Tax=Dovyalis caffra TaxID=77055 RepID=A0AAV1SWS9_9ROSI|nr:unnamed protein product [Dovyalis caffra]